MVRVNRKVGNTLTHRPTKILRLYYDSYKLKTLRSKTESLGIYRVFDINSQQHKYRHDPFHGGGWSRGGGYHIYIYTYIYISVCVCVCAERGQRENHACAHAQAMLVEHLLCVVAPRLCQEIIKLSTVCIGVSRRYILLALATSRLHYCSSCDLHL